MSTVNTFEDFSVLVESGEIPDYIYRARKEDDPRNPVRKALGTYWMLRHPQIFGLMLFVIAAICTEAPALAVSKFGIPRQWWFEWMFFSGYVLAIPAAVFVVLESAKESGWKKVQPFAQEYGKMLEALDVSAREFSALQKISALAIAERKMINVCKEVLEYKRRTQRLVPTDDIFNGEIKLREKVKNTYDALLPFELVMTNEGGRAYSYYYAVATEELYGNAI